MYKIGNNRDCVIQSCLSAWVVRDFLSHSLHSVVAWFEIGDFCLHVPTAVENSLLLGSKHDLIYHRQRTPWLTPDVMPFLAHWIMDNRRDWIGNYRSQTDWLRVYFKMVEPSGNLWHKNWRGYGISIRKFTIVFPRVFVFLVCCNGLVNI